MDHGVHNCRKLLVLSRIKQTSKWYYNINKTSFLIAERTAATTPAFILQQQQQQHYT